MAVAAVDPIVEYVMEMAELHRLLDVLVRPGDVGRTPEEHGEQDQPCNQRERTGETELGKRISAAMEDLRHRRLIGVTDGWRSYGASPDLYHNCEKRIKRPTGPGRPLCSMRILCVKCAIHIHDGAPSFRTRRYTIRATTATL